jgi:hypothetical protein
VKKKKSDVGIINIVMQGDQFRQWNNEKQTLRRVCRFSNDFATTVLEENDAVDLVLALLPLLLLPLGWEYLGS